MFGGENEWKKGKKEKNKNNMDRIKKVSCWLPEMSDIDYLISK